MNQLPHWKAVFILTVFMLFGMLFMTLYIDKMRLPDSGYSRGIEIASCEATDDYEDYYSKNAFIVPLHDKFSLIYSDSTSVSLLNINAFAETENKLKLNTDISVQSLNGRISYDQNLITLFFSDKTHNYYEQTFSLKSGDPIQDPKLIITNPRRSYLGPDHLIYADNHAISLYYNSEHFKIYDAQLVETLASYHDDKQWYITFTCFDQNAYHQKLVILDDAFKIVKEFELQRFSGSNSMLPSEIALFVHQDHIYSTTVFKDQKSGTNYVYLFDGLMDASKPFKMTQFTSKNYSLFPTYYLRDNQVMIALSSDTSIGRVDLQTSGDEFTNLVTRKINEMTYTSLTNTIHPSIKPIFFELKSESTNETYQYFVSTEISKNESKMYLSSNRPELIEKSLKITGNEILDLTMTTLTTFIPLSYVGLILEVYILVPVLIMVLIISMFYINWAERNGNKLLQFSLLLHIISKIIFVNSKIIGQTERLNGFPFFLNSPFKVYLWGTALTVIAIYCFLDFNKRNRGAHYLKSYFFFNVVDLIFFVMMYTPYLFLS